MHFKITFAVVVFVFTINGNWIIIMTWYQIVRKEWICSFDICEISCLWIVRIMNNHITEVCSSLWFLWCNIWKLFLAVQITRISWRYSKNNFLFKLDSIYWLTKRRWVLCLWSTCYWSIPLLKKHKRNRRLNRPNYLHLTFHFFYDVYDLLSLSLSLSLLSTFSFIISYTK